MDDDDNGIKIILLGEACTGKTNLINIYCNLTFNSNYIPNITSAILEKKTVIGKIQYLIKLYDIAGDQKFRSLNNLFIKDSKICIFVYDISKRDTFEELDFWVKTTDEILGKNPILAIVANKSDLEENVTKQEGEEYAKKIGAFFYQMSAKNDTGNFENFVDKLVEEFLRKNNIYGWEMISKEDEMLSIDNTITLKNDYRQDNSCII